MSLRVRIQSIAVPPLALRAEVRPESLNPETRTVEVIFSTGAPVERVDWATETRYLETLSLKRSAVRLERLNAGAPFLDSHGAYSVRDSLLGVVEAGSAKVVDGQGVATVRISKNVESVWQDLRDGIIRNVSVGYRVHKYEQTEAANGQPTIRHAVDWEPYEISAVPMGADAGAKVRADQNVSTNACELVMQVSEEKRAMEPKATAVEPTDTHVDPRDPGAPVAGTEPRAATPAETERQLGRDAERQRVVGIAKAVRHAGFESTMADRLIEEGLSLEAAQTRVLEALAQLDRGGPSATAGREVVRVGEDLSTKHIRLGIENALLHRMAPEFFTLEDVGRAYAGSSLLDFARYCLQARGVRTTGLSRMEIAGLGLGLNTRTGLHTTSDFSNILADVANKTLRRAYDEAPQTFAPIVRRSALPDFKLVRRVQLGEAPALEVVAEHGEFKRGTIGDAKEQYQLATYGKVFGITRQALVNDDTDAFSRLAVMFGRMARHKESDLVWAQITSNPVMGDGVTLFHTASHGNLASANAAIDVDPIGIGRAAMRNQTGLGGVEKLNIAPRYLIVPVGKETLADKFVSVNLLASAASSVNPFAGKLTVIAEPRLDAASATAWYLAASPDQVDIIELGFLAGEMGPVVESRVGFDVDGVEIKVRHDVAAKVIDHRGLFKNAGA